MDNIEIRTLAEEIRDQLTPDLELEFAERYDADHTQSDTAKVQELLDLDPDRANREGVAKFVEWYRENRKWYEPLCWRGRRAPVRRLSDQALY